MGKWILVIWAFFFLNYRVNVRSQYQRWGIFYTFNWADGSTTYRLFGTALDEKDCNALKDIQYKNNKDVVCRKIK